MLVQFALEATAKDGLTVLSAANANAGEQITDIHNLVSAGAKALVIDAADSKAVNPAVNFAAGRNVPVIAVDIPPSGGKLYMSETIGATCVSIIREGMDEAIRRGVPEQAARDFILGHLNVEIAIVFNELKNGTFSDGAKTAIEKAKHDLFRPDWKKVFEPEAITQSIHDIPRS